MLRSVQCPQRKTRLLLFRVDGTSTASIVYGGEHGTLVDNGTGDYTITFEIPSVLTPVIVGFASITANIQPAFVVTATTIQVLTTNNSGSATDADFHLSVMLIDTRDPS